MPSLFRSHGVVLHGGLLQRNVDDGVSAAMFHVADPDCFHMAVKLPPTPGSTNYIGIVPIDADLSDDPSDRVSK